MRRTTPLIVGGGPAGSAAALRLAQAGVQPLLIERGRPGHDPVCGGFLGWDALAMLDRLGVDPWSLGAQPITRLRVVAGKAVAEAPLPHRAAGLSRRTLDEALLAAAAGAGAGVERGVAAREAGAEGVRLGDGAMLQSDSLFLATGKYELRGMARSTGRHGAVGLRTAIPAPSDLAGWIELHLLDGGYAGLAMQEDGSANLCLSVDPGRLAAAGGVPQRLVEQIAAEAPRLADRLGAGPMGGWSAIAAVPYGWRATDTASGQFRLGDQAAVIASLAGDGVAIALASGIAAADAWAAGGAVAAPAFQRGFARRSRRPITIAEQLRHTAQRPGLAAPLTRMLGLLPASLGIAARLTRIGI